MKCIGCDNNQGVTFYDVYKLTLRRSLMVSVMEVCCATMIVIVLAICDPSYVAEYFPSHVSNRRPNFSKLHPKTMPQTAPKSTLRCPPDCSPDNSPD